jgi:hypothetical protein
MLRRFDPRSVSMVRRLLFCLPLLIAGRDDGGSDDAGGGGGKTDCGATVGLCL